MVSRFIAGLFATLAAGMALAQNPSSSAVLPGQVEKQFVPEPQPRARPEEILIPETGRHPAPENAAAIRFRLNGVVVEGATIYDRAALAASYESRLGQEVSLADIHAIAGNLTARYRNDGYLLSQVIVPAQTVDAGVIRLRAIEGSVADVRIEGVSPTPDLVQALAEKIRAARPLSIAILERYLLLMNDLPGLQAKATLMASKTQAGAAELLIQASERRTAGGIRFDNRGGRAMGPNRLNGDVDLNNLLGPSDRTGVRLVTTGNRELDYLFLSHEQYAGSEGGKLGLNYQVTRARPQGTVTAPLNLETSGASMALAYSYPMQRSRNENLYLRGSLSAHNGQSEILGAVGTRDRIRALRVGATYDRLDAWRGINVVDVEYGHGLNTLGASAHDDPLLSRTNGRPDFRKLSWYAGRLQSLVEGWSLLAAMSGQHAFTNLLAPELYSFGGTQFGRGYDPSELVGDHGAAFKLELRHKGRIPGTVSATAYGYYDEGSVRQRTPAGLAARETAASAGLGLRATLDRQVSVFVELAKPLARIVAAEGSRDLRTYGGLSIRF